MPKRAVFLGVLFCVTLLALWACASMPDSEPTAQPVVLLAQVGGATPSSGPPVRVSSTPSITLAPVATATARATLVPAATRVFISPTPAVADGVAILRGAEQVGERAKSVAPEDGWVPPFALTATSIPTPTPLPTPRLMATAVISEMTVFPVQTGKSLLVDQSMQVLRVYEQGLEVRALPVSTGLRKSYTPAFNGRVGRYLERMYGYGAFADHAWYLTKAYGNIYIHGAPYTLVGEQKLYEGLDMLGVAPSSHGCIRLHPDDAAWLFEWDPRGVPILVTGPDFVKFTF